MGRPSCIVGGYWVSYEKDFIHPVHPWDGHCSSHAKRGLRSESPFGQMDVASTSLDDEVIVGSGAVFVYVQAFQFFLFADPETHGQFDETE
jgi:hypothetical protein